jgi:hypothetical protein
VKGWQILQAYPTAPLKGSALKWFLRVKPSGVVVDLLTGMEAGGLYYEMM